MFALLKSRLPSKDSLRNNRWLRWLGPRLFHPNLWHLNRKSVALGLAVGVFFGFLIPVAQIPFAATTAIVLRANLPVAITSTLVTNPITFAPVYYGAYRLGKFIVLHEEPAPEELKALLAHKVREHEKSHALGPWQRIQYGWHRLGQVGKPLIVGLAIVACSAGLLVYFMAHLLWIWRIRWERRRRLAKMRNPM